MAQSDAAAQPSVSFTKEFPGSQPPYYSISLRQDGVALRGVFWRGAERASLIEHARAALDVAFSVEQNTFNGTTRIEVSLADVRATERGDR